ncbi:MAG: glycosyltransferase family 87 protein [Solirubrobacteraceae bacterium]
MSRERKTSWLVFIVLLGFVAAVVAHYIVAQYVMRGYPFSTFLFKPQDTTGFPGAPNIIGVHYFGDFFEAWLTSRGPNPYVDYPLSAPSSYFPITHIILFPLAQLPLEPALLIYLGGFTAALAALVFTATGGDRLSRTQAALVLTACSTPVLFVIDRANVEGLLFLFLTGALLAYRRERFYVAAVLIAIPAAMKGSPGIFWLLFVFDGQFRALLVSVATFTFGTAAALLVLPGSTSANIDGLSSALDGLLTATGEGTVGLRHSASLKAAFSGLGRLDEHFNFFVVNYMFVTLAILVGVALALALVRMDLWQRVALLSAAMILVPSVSYNYRMIHVYLPLLLFLDVSERRRFDALYVALFGLLLVPKALPNLYADVDIGTVINPLLLVALMGAVVIDAARTGGVSLSRPGAARAAPAG